MGGGRMWVVALIAGAVGAIAASGIGMASGAFNRQTTVLRSYAPSTTPVSLAADSGDAAVTTDNDVWPSVDDAVAPSIVSISVTTASGPETGSGLVLLPGADSSTAFVITARSLFTAEDTGGYMGGIEVAMSDGQQVPARFVGEDALSGLALVAITGSSLVYPQLGSVAELEPAQSVLTMNARSAINGSVQVGRISGEDRTVSLTEGTDMDNLIAVGMNPAASNVGGPIVDALGRVVGITIPVNAVDPDDQDLTFAVPIDEAKRVAQQIVDSQTVTHPWVGISDLQDTPSAMARSLGVSGGVQADVVFSSSPATQSGISAGDVITSFNGQPVNSTGILTAILNDCTIGHSASITYIHDSRTITSTIQIVNEPADS